MSQMDDKADALRRVASQFKSKRVATALRALTKADTPAPSLADTLARYREDGRFTTPPSRKGAR